MAPVVMNAWTITLECPQCAGTDFEHVTSSRARSTLNTTASTIIACTGCDATWQIAAELSRAAARDMPAHRPPDRPPARCGTQRGYDRHRTAKTPICDACKVAHAVYEHRRAAGAPVSTDMLLTAANRVDRRAAA